MRGAILRLCEPLRRSPTSRLPINATVALAIRLKRDPFAIRGPDGEAIVSAKRDALHRGATPQRVHVGIGLLAVIDAERDAGAVGRDPRVRIHPRWQVQSFNDPPGAIDQGKIMSL